jgi:hypothetical protein
MTDDAISDHDEALDRNAAAIEQILISSSSIVDDVQLSLFQSTAVTILPQMVYPFDDPGLIHVVHVPISYVRRYLHIILLRNLHSLDLPHSVPYQWPESRLLHEVWQPSRSSESTLRDPSRTPVCDD